MKTVAALGCGLDHNGSIILWCGCGKEWIDTKPSYSVDSYSGKWANGPLTSEDQVHTSRQTSITSDDEWLDGASTVGDAHDKFALLMEVAESSDGPSIESRMCGALAPSTSGNYDLLEWSVPGGWATGSRGTYTVLAHGGVAVFAASCDEPGFALARSSLPPKFVYACCRPLDVETESHIDVAVEVTVYTDTDKVVCNASAMYQPAIGGVCSGLEESLAGGMDNADSGAPVLPDHAVSGYSYGVQQTGCLMTCHVGLLSKHLPLEVSQYKLAIAAMSGEKGVVDACIALSMLSCDSCETCGSHDESIVWSPHEYMIHCSDHSYSTSMDEQDAHDVAGWSWVTHLHSTMSDHDNVCMCVVGVAVVFVVTEQCILSESPEVSHPQQNNQFTSDEQCVPVVQSTEETQEVQLRD